MVIISRHSPDARKKNYTMMIIKPTKTIEKRTPLLKVSAMTQTVKRYVFNVTIVAGISGSCMGWLDRCYSYRRLWSLNCNCINGNIISTCNPGSGPPSDPRYRPVFRD